MEQRQPCAVGSQNQITSCIVSIISRPLFEFECFSPSAHVRATTAGTLSLDNSHPFTYGNLMVRYLQPPRVEETDFYDSLCTTAISRIFRCLSVGYKLICRMTYLPQ